MLDRSHPGFEAVLDGARPIGVRQDIGADRARHFDGSRELLDRKLDVVQFVGRRGGAATGHHLDLVGAAPQHLAGRPADRVRSVGEDRLGGQAGYHRKGRPRGPGAMVAVAAGLGDEGAADEDPRAPDQSKPDGLLESPIQSTGIAHGREAGVEGGFDHPRDPQGEHRRRQGRLRGGIEVEQRQVDVRVEQSGHQRPSLAVNHPRVRSRRRSGGSGRLPRRFAGLAADRGRCSPAGWRVRRRRSRPD